MLLEAEKQFSASVLLEKWTGPDVPEALNVSDIADPRIQIATARIMQNIVNESVRAEDVKNSMMLFEAPSSVAPSSVATGWTQPVALALARRVVPDLFAWKCVNVQPMQGPVGLAFAERIVYKGTNVEATFDNMPEYSGFTGSTSGTTGPADMGTGVATAVAEQWAIGSTMPELVYKMVSKAVQAISRKIAADVSIETITDIQAMHDINVITRIVNKLHAQSVAEIDRELLQAMKTTAVDTGNQADGSPVGGAAAYTFYTSAADGTWQGQKYGNVANAVVALGEVIGETTRVAPANFVVVSRRVASALNATPQIYTAHQTGNQIGSTALALVGKLNGSIDVYVDRYAGNNDYALAGLNGQGDSEFGIIYSPYVMGLESEATGQDQFSRRVGVMNRYAITTSLLGSGRYYRLMNFVGLSALTLV